MKQQTPWRIILLIFYCFANSTTLPTKSCILNNELDDFELISMPNGCTDIEGDLNITAAINESLLITKFSTIRTIHGCVSIVDSGLMTFSFLKTLEVINCSNTEGDVLYISSNGWPAYSHLGFDNLRSIIGPGFIEIRANFADSQSTCWTYEEFRLLVRHPQYRGKAPPAICNGSKVCTAVHPFFDIPPECECLTATRFLPGLTHGEEVERLRNIRTIHGGLSIYRTFLHNLSFLSNLEMITYQQTYFTGPAFYFIDNDYLLDATLPKLNFIYSYDKPAVITYNTPKSVVPDDFCENVTSSKYPPDPKNIVLRNCDIKRFFKTFVLPVSQVHIYKLINMLVYYPLLATALLFNIRTLTYWLFGSIRHQLSIAVILQLILLSLIQCENIIFHQDIMIPRLRLGAKVYFRYLIGPMTLHFLELLIAFRDAMLYVPHFLYLHAFLHALCEKTHFTARWITKLFVLMGCIGLVSYTIYNYNSVTVSVKMYNKERNSLNFKVKRRNIPKDQLNYPFLQAEDSATKMADKDMRNDLVYQLYTDGWNYDWPRYLSEVLVFLIAIVYHWLNCWTNIFARYKPERWLKLVLLQFCLFRYSALRNYFYFGVDFKSYECRRLNDVRWTVNGCFIYTSDLAVLIVHRIIYVFMTVVAVYGWYMARYDHKMNTVIHRISQQGEREKDDEVPEAMPLGRF